MDSMKYIGMDVHKETNRELTRQQICIPNGLESL
jgi:hypothetical protein